MTSLVLKLYWFTINVCACC